MKKLLVLLPLLVALQALAQEAPEPDATQRLAFQVADAFHTQNLYPEIGVRICPVDGELSITPYVPLSGPLSSCESNEKCQASGEKDCRELYHCGAKSGSGTVSELEDGTGSCKFECECNGAIGIRRCYKPSLPVSPPTITRPDRRPLR